MNKKYIQLQSFDNFCKNEIPYVYKQLKTNYKKQRQMEGIIIAKRDGKYKGRKPIEIEDSKFNAAYERYMRREINKTELARELKISRPTLDKIIRRKINGISFYKASI